MRGTKEGTQGMYEPQTDAGGIKRLCNVMLCYAPGQRQIWLGRKMEV